MIDAKIKLCTAQTSEKFTEDIKTIQRRMKGKWGYVYIMNTPANKFGVFYDTNHVPALDSQHFETLDEARACMLNVVHQIIFDLGCAMVVINDRPKWIEFYQKNKHH
jgi:hypothetical protein